MKQKDTLVCECGCFFFAPLDDFEILPTIIQCLECGKKHYRNEDVPISIRPAPGTCCPDMKICKKCGKCKGHGACKCK